MTRVLFALALLVLTAGLGRAAGQPPVASGEQGSSYQTAVSASDVAALDLARIEIQKSIAVGGVEQGQIAAWRYDWAYLNWRINHALGQSDKKRGKTLLKEAEAQLDLLIELEPENAEAHALRGSVIGDRIEGGFSGAILGRRSSRSHELALELEPDNPRAALLHGIGLHYTPKTFGGGQEQAEEELRRAVDLFESEPSDREWPNWGHVDAFAWLGIVVSERGGEEEARSLFEQALVLDPSNVWIRDELVQSMD